MKRVYRISLLLFFLIVLATSAHRIRYFLTEQDFLTNRPVPESEVLNHAHVRAEYDQLDRLIIKAQVDQYGNVLRTENYGYRDSSHVIRQKEVHDGQGNLKYRTTFGPEPQSIAYINYVFGLDSVKKWDDRFTTSELNPRGQPENYRFYDVDAFEYGGMEFDYDSTGRMTRQEWFRRPDDKSMHKFLYDYIPGTDITHIFEYDSNGILVMDVKLSADGTEALLSFITPRDSTVVNNSVVTYDLDDDLQWGKISWITSGVADTQKVLLGESGLTRGRHRISFSDETFLRDSMIYNVLFTGMGTKGYRATSRSIHHLVFDISPPVITLNIASYINEPVVRFMTSEPLDSAFLVWQLDSLLSDTISLTVNELMKLSEPFRPIRQTPLRDGNVYTVKLFGFDQAQNLSLPAIADSIHYDITPAVVIIESPAAGTYINHQVVSFKPYETIQNWVVEWIWQSGTLDERAPYRFEFSDTVLAALVSETDLQPYFQPVDGAVYALKITTIDLAGNHSDPVTVDSLHYDVTPPVLTMIFPFDDAAMKNPAISYAVDEPLQAGEFLWTQISGTPDSLSPQVAALAGDELTSQEKIHINLWNEPRLVDGAYYTLTFTGRDLAGNDSEPVVVNRILFDASPPMFSRVKPDSGAALNTVKLSYEISENLAKGSVLWVNTGGVEDPDAPHLAWLEGKELIGEFHRQITLLNEPNLHDGSVYTLFLTGSDRAGNIADTVKITDVLYDFTAPEIAIEYPKQRSISNTQRMTYTLSEELQSGSFRWIWLGGNPDSLAPYTVTLNEKELLKGRHENVLLDSMPDFQENALYTLIVKGSDRAGNQSKPKMVPGLQYDFTPPVITWYEPKNNAAVNHKKIHYELSELLATGKITWVWTGGNIDPDSVHMVQLAGEELYGQEHSLSSLIKSPPLEDGAIYDIEFSGEDPAGNQSNRINIKNVFYDMTVPRIKPLNPVEYAYISSPAVSYELSEKLDRGEIIYTRSSGSIDPASPHKFEMDSTLRSMGIHDSVFKIQGPELVEGGVYTISFSGRDRAGNIASAVQIRGVIYDATPPILTLSFPQSEQAVNHTLVSYGNSENLKNARMTWTRIKGVNDLNSPHVVELADKELEKGLFTDHVLAGNPDLVDGSVYQIEFVGIDFAGNPSDTLKIGPVTYDVTPPTLSFVAPTSNIFTTKTDLTYSLSEDLAQGRLIWEGTGTGGEQLFDSFDLLEDAAVAGEHHSDVYYVPDLQDGAVYTVTLEGQDAAGNKAEPVQLTNYRVDRTPPQFSAFSVPDHAFIKDLDFGWELSENISSGTIIFKSLKTNQTITVSLQKDELNGGVRSPGKLLEKIPLVDGAQYEIQLVGIDFAGNISDTLTVDSVTYDISPPELVLLKPQKGEHIRGTIVRYKTNESLVKAVMIWLVTNQGEKEFSLNQTDLSTGLHSLDNYDIILPENEPIELFIRGSDRAGNQSVTDTITGLTFDQTPPVLALLTPAGNDAVNHTRVSYSTSETLSRASLQWESADNSDPGAPYIINLVENDLLIGDHLEIELSAPPALKDGKRYNITFSGQDLSGNEAQSVTVNNILYDVTPPQFSDITPVDSQYIREVNLSYTLSENLKSGQIIFENIGGSPDPEKKRIVNLVGKRKLKGPGGGLIPAKLIPLVNGSIYRLYFEGIDSAGNTTPETIINQLTFDNETPVIVLISPASSSFINSEAISYSISEDLAGAEVTLEQVGGNEDPKSPRQVKLTLEARRQGTYSEQIITDMGPLVDGAVYNLTISGRDRAGNEADSALVTMVTYDITPPVITIANPKNNSAINYQTLSYTLSEDLFDGMVNFTPLTKISERLQPYDVYLTGDELLAGEKDSVALANSRPLINGVTYSMKFNGQDRAGNPAEPATIENVFFDNQAPEASLSKPIDGEQIKNTEITYLLSENLEQGFAVFSQTGGTIDPLSPHKVPLKPEQRSKGLHSDVDIKLDDKLADGGRYSITIEGFDRAGNRVKVTPVKDILFDVRPPQLALLYPPESIAVNRISVSYRTSEEMLKGTITLSRTGGADDPSSPHTYNLAGDQLKQGKHNDVTLDLPLQDGSIYSIAFSGADLAGNQSEPVTVADIRYDITAPVIQINQPIENTYYQELKLAFTVDEPLKTVDIILERRGGTADADSPRSVSLEKNLLSAGKHEDINLVELLHPVDGTTYNIKIESQDLAGNRAETVEILNLVYDISPPQLSIQAPIPSGYYNNTLVSLTSSENLASGQISWERVEGETDPASPHMVELTEAYLTAGNHPEINLVMPSTVVSGAGYKITFTGIDQAGNQQSTQVEPIYFDNSPAVVTGLYPSNNTFINLPEVSFSVNEPLTEATLDWKPDDPTVATVKVSLAGTELDSGTFSRGTLQNQSNLHDGIIYSLAFHGTDRAGNTVETVLAEKVTFDISKPKFTQLVPTTGARVNSPLIKWTVNEELQSGSYIWIYMGGQEDSGAPHEVNFSNDLLTKGDHDNSQLPSPELVANAMYRITLEGTDLAGNSGKKFIMSVVYDDLPPSLEILYPEAGSSVNDVDIAYEITESLKSGHFTYTRTGGELDPASPHTLELSGLELETVYKSPKTPNQPPVLQDGSVYKIEFEGRDLADNSSAAEVVENVLYDVTKPVIVIQQPVKSRYTIGSMIAFSLSEDIENGTVFWTHTGGTADPRLTHELALPAEYLKAGTYKDVTLSFTNPLIAGGVYALSITGTDPAGNENQPVQVEDITYIRSMAGKWYFKGAIIEVVWLFEPESGSDGSKGSFVQGLSLGTKISDQETGRYQFDFNAKPWTLTLDMDNPEKSRISLFEFINNNHMRVITGTKKPKSWSDGEIMEYEFRP